MNESELSRIDDSKYNRVITPVKREKKIYENPLIIGFDAVLYSTIGIFKYLCLTFHKDGETRSYFANDIYWPYNTPHTCNGKYTIQVLTDYIFHFLSELKIEYDSDCIYLLTHNANDELSHFDIPKNYKLKPIGKGLCLERTINNTLLNKDLKLKIIDIYSLINKSLKDIGNYIGIPRVTSNDLFGRLKGLRFENLDISQLFDDDMFGNDCLMDAEITFEAFTRLRLFFIENHNVDLLNFYTLPSLAGYLFRRDNIKRPIVKSKSIKEPRKQKKTLADGSLKYYDVLQPVEIYNGDLTVRKYSMLAYHGGRIESFCRGRFEDTRLIYYDVDSLYSSSSILQPLPMVDTKWIEFNKRYSEKFLSEAEGFVEVEFRYKPDTFYPCLPVSGIRDDILYFPLSGTTYCTIAELRKAIQLGLSEYEILSGHGFYPLKREKQHPLASFMSEMHKRKQESEKGSLEYIIYKMLMNSLVGKFAQRDKNGRTLDMLQEGKISRDICGTIDNIRKSTTGSLWYPEWASLILGKARALMSDFICKGTYFVSSDSVLLPKDININCDSLDELRRVGSNLRKEFAVDHGLIIRTRLYALNPLSENPGQRHLARHAVSCDPEEFREIMVEGYENKTIPDLTYTSKKLIRYEKSILEEKELNSIETTESSIDIKWDGKRRLFHKVENPFNDFSWSEALDVKEVENNNMRRPPKEKPGRKAGKKLDTPKKRDIVGLHEEGKKQKEIAEELEVSKGYVSKVLQEIRTAEETKLDG